MDDSFVDKTVQDILGGTYTDTQSQDPVDAQVQAILGGTVESSPQPSQYGAGWDEFASKAKDIAGQRGYPLSVLLGQAALESAHGSSNFARKRNNYFGYQAYDSNPDAAAYFSSPEESINKYIDLIQDPSFVYSQAWQNYLQDKDPAKLIQGIKAAGYASSPNYAQNVMNTEEFQNNYGSN